MKSFVSIFMALLCSFQLAAMGPVGKIAKANEAKEKAQEAFEKGDFEAVVKNYTYLLDSLHYDSPEAELNRAHAYFQLNDTIKAFDAYRQVSDVEDAQLKSKAMLQLGNLSEMQQEYESALSFFKESLRADPTNEKARYNYELLRKKMEKNEKEQQDKNQDKEQQDQEKEDQESKENKEKQDSENQNQEKNQDKSQEDQDSEKQQKKKDAEQQEGDKGEQGEQEEQKKGEEQQEGEQQKQGEKQDKGEESEMNPSTKKKLEDMNMSEEKAKMILEALRNKESQYFQQLRKKATKRQESGKPDW